MKALAIFYLIGLSTTIIALTQGFLRFNIYLIAVMGIIACVQLFRLPSILQFPTVILFYLMTALFPLCHFESYRISTVLFTGMFCCSYMFFMDLIYKKVITSDLFVKFLRYLIFAYFIVLVMQQIGVLTGSWIINKGGFESLSIAKLNSLCTEPAHSTLILFLAVNSYLVIHAAEQNRSYTLTMLMKEEMKLFLAYSYCMLTMGSVTGIILYAFSFLLQRQLNAKQILPGIGTAAIVALFVVFIDNPLNERIRMFFSVLWKMDPEYLRSTDASAAARIAPFMLYFENLDIGSWNFWFGAGIDQCQVINRTFFHYDLDSESGMGGMFPNYLIDFGFIPFVSFVIMCGKYCVRKNNINQCLYDILVLVIVCIPNGINMAVLWFGIVTLTAAKFFSDIQENEDRKTVKNKIFASGQAILAASDGVLPSSVPDLRCEPDAKISKWNDASIGVLNPETNKRT